MKWSVIIMAGAVLAISCGKAVKASQSADDLVEWTFVAPATKASLSADGAFSWSPGDEIAVWNATESSYVTFRTGTGNGRFSATAPASANFTTGAYYPSAIVSGGGVTIPSSYTVADLSSGAGMPMFAAVEDDSNLLEFRHVCAYLTVQARSLGNSIDRITVGSSTVSLSGVFVPADAGGGKREIRSASGSEVVSIGFTPSDNQDISFTIPVPVGEYSITIEAGNEDVSDVLSAETAPVNFLRGHLYTLSAIGESVFSVTFTTEPYGLEPDSNNWE